MKQKIQILPSGISMIDEAWGGFYRGGTYILSGPHKSGRTTLALEFVRECTKQKEICLYFTTRRPKDLLLQSASINFDLENHIAQNSVVIIRVESPIKMHEINGSDSFLTEYIKEIVTIVDQYKPIKIVFDEMTPFLEFKDLKLFEETFSKTIETIEEFGVTSIFVVGDPITSTAKKVLDILSSHANGTIYLQKDDEKGNNVTGGSIEIKPNIGHSEGRFKSGFFIVPGRGFTFEAQNLPTARYYSNGHSISAKSKYKLLSEIDIPTYEYQISNLYSYEDFSLIVSNQIAFFRSTGQAFTLISFRLNTVAVNEGILTMNQLRNAIRLAVENKDKICVVSNKVIVLLSKEDNKDITGLVARVKGNLFTEDNNSMVKLLFNISVYAIRVDESVNSSEEMLKELMMDEFNSKNIFDI